MARQTQPGSLPERIQLQAETLTSDGGGGNTLDWVTLATLWAEVVPQRGQEIVAADQLQPRAEYRITIRNRSGISTSNRLLWRGQPLDIVSAIDPGPRALYRVIEANSGGVS